MNHPNLAMLDEVLGRFPSNGSCLVLTHTNPDPDAIAAGEGLRVLLRDQCRLNVTLGYTGVIERAENKAFVEILEIPARRIELEEVEAFDVLALVDTTPDAGNHVLPPHIKPQIVVDHHPLGQEILTEIAWADVREDVGASATLVLAYLKWCRIPIDARLATILLYGIMTDTMDLGRGHCREDIDAYLELLPLCDLPTLSRIRNPQLSFEYYRIMADGLQRAVVFDGRLVALVLDRIPYPDLTAELADFLLRAEGIETSFCTGHTQDRLRFSIRTRAASLDAGHLARSLVAGLGDAGGHQDMAGGSASLSHDRDYPVLARAFLDRLLEVLDMTALPRNLVIHEADAHR